MTKINLSALEITTESEWNSLRDDGFVADMGLHYDRVTSDIWEKYGDVAIENGSRPEEGVRGQHLMAHLDNIVLHIIFYSDYGSELKNVLLRAHEETHVLHAIGQIRLLQDKLDKLGLRINLMRYRDYEMSEEYEFVANIGGLYAAYREGATSITVDRNENPELWKAIRMYQDALKSPFRIFYKVLDRIGFARVLRIIPDISHHKAGGNYDPNPDNQPPLEEE